jgi:AAA15 family ATPase/GTPase
LDIDIAAINITETELGPEDPPHRGSLLKENRETGSRHSIIINTRHQDIAGNPVVLNFIKHESGGTQRLAGLIGLILHALKTGGVFLVDELECSIHPLLMREIVLLFKKRRHNPKGAQLIFTTHNTDILDDSILRLSEIALVRKTVANGTLVRRLVDVKNDGVDIRNDTNSRKQYLAGFYSGVPHPAL